jgi:hypothetical protein
VDGTIRSEDGQDDNELTDIAMDAKIAAVQTEHASEFAVPTLSSIKITFITLPM